MWFWPFKPSRAKSDADRLLALVNSVSRNPAFFGPGRAPDTVDGRFEMLTICTSVALMRLQREQALAPLAQAFTDAVFRALDSGLRELGVSDTAVPKRMHQLAGAFYGRLQFYSAAVADRDRRQLCQGLVRYLTGEGGLVFADRLAGHILSLIEAHAAAPAEALFDPDSWPAVEG